MSKDYTVQGIESKREWSGKYGPMVTYLVKLAGEDEFVEVNRKPTTDAPKDGEVLTGELIPNANPQFPAKLKVDKPAFTPGQGGGFKRSPADTKAIQRQHSQEMALRYLTLVGKTNATLEDVSSVAAYFDQDIVDGSAIVPEVAALTEKTGMPF